MLKEIRDAIPVWAKRFTLAAGVVLAVYQLLGLARWLIATEFISKAAAAEAHDKLAGKDSLTEIKSRLDRIEKNNDEQHGRIIEILLRGGDE